MLLAQLDQRRHPEFPYWAFPMCVSRPDDHGPSAFSLDLYGLHQEEKRRVPYLMIGLQSAALAPGRVGSG
jgi:hypothetical protein